ncbi:MAG: ABC transporter permease [Anaerolineae bacterium]|nr:ABC transporter permease [Anaerolineae bacterium]
MERTVIWAIAQRELREALRNKWLWLYALGFAGLALALSRAGLAAAGYAGLGGFGRTAASLVNALLMFVPLIGLTVGAGTLAGERERGTLLYLLSQPINRSELFIGKAVGAGLAVLTALALGLGLAGLGLAAAGGDAAATYLALGGYTFLLALAALGLGLIISAVARKGAAASAAAMLLWLLLVFLGDLGVIGLTLSLRPTPAVLFSSLLINPLQIFKLGAIHSLRAGLDVLGPVGQYATYRFGDALPLLLIGLLLAWIIASFTLAFALFQRQVGE